MKKLLLILTSILLCSLLVFGLQSPAQISNRQARFDVRVDNVIVPIFDQDIDAKVGSSFEVNVYYANLGDKTKTILRVSTDEGNNFDKTILFRGVNWITGEIELGHQSFYPVFYTPGNHTFNVTIDPENRVHEWDEINNQVISQVFEVKDVHTVEGTVTQLFSMEDVNNESVIVNATVTVGEYSTTTDGNGHYYLEVPEAGQYQVTVDAEGYFQRITYVEINSVESFDINLIPIGFPMEFFNEIARPEGYLTKWSEQPTFYIDNGSAFGSGILPTITQTNFVNEIITTNDDLFAITDGFVNNPTVITQDNVPAQGTPGVVVFMWVDSGSNYGSSVIWEDDSGIYHARATSRTNVPLNGVYRRNLAASMGFLMPYSNSYTSSVFNYAPQTEPIIYQDIDSFIGKIIYDRSVGSTSPDIDSNPFVTRQRFDQITVRDGMDNIYSQRFYLRDKDELQEINLMPEIKKILNIPEQKKIFLNAKTKEIRLQY